MKLNNELGEMYASVAGRSDEGNTVFEIHSIPYARAERFEKPVLIEDYPAGQPINKKETLCFPQHGYPRLVKRFMKQHMMRPEFLPKKDVQTEDAFVLNIWTDDLTGRKPVAVFIHGGGEGSGTVPIYSGGHLAEHGVVAVTITYRVGNFGYMPFFEKDRMSANLAYYDQQAALIWIRNNIQHFGGDPENITLMGHCAGGLASLYHLLNPVSSKQFDRLILFSGYLPHIIPRWKAEKQFGKWLKQQKLKNPGKLRKVKAKALLEKHTPIAQGDLIDGDFFTEDPEKLLEKGEFPSMPILLGTNADELSMFRLPMYHKPMGITANKKNLDSVLRGKYGKYAGILKKTFEKDAAGPVDIQTKIMELLMFHNSSFQMMKKFARKCPVYGYRLHYAPALFKGVKGSCHGAEIALFFGNMDKMHIPVTEENKKQTEILQSDWLSFIKNGEIPGRDRYDKTGMITDYDDEITSIPFPDKKLIKRVNNAGLCRKAREEYLRNM